MGEKVGELGWGILSPLFVAVPAAVGSAIDADYKAANAGLEKKKVFIQKHPESDLYQRHKFIKKAIMNKLKVIFLAVS